MRSAIALQWWGSRQAVTACAFIHLAIHTNTNPICPCWLVSILYCSPPLCTQTDTPCRSLLVPHWTQVQELWPPLRSAQVHRTHLPRHSAYTWRVLPPHLDKLVQCLQFRVMRAYPGHVLAPIIHFYIYNSFVYIRWLGELEWVPRCMHVWWIQPTKQVQYLVITS